MTKQQCRDCRPSYPTHLQPKFPFLRMKETISAGNFIGLDHLQKGPPSLAARATAWHFLLMQKMVDLALIGPASILNSGIQTRGILQRKA